MDKCTYVDACANLKGYVEEELSIMYVKEANIINSTYKSLLFIIMFLFTRIHFSKNDNENSNILRTGRTTKACAYAVTVMTSAVNSGEPTSKIELLNKKILLWNISAIYLCLLIKYF